MPLGGLGEVGLNMWALESEGQVLVVDAGLMFPQDDMLGIDLVIPDIAYLLEEGRRVVGIFLTHGHEDHIGGLPFVLKRLWTEGAGMPGRAQRGSPPGLLAPPIYGTALTLGLARHRLREHRILREADLREVRPGDRVQLGPFRVEAIAVCHSIPDAVGVAVDTPVGKLVYTGDFKLDPDPPYGRATDVARFRRLGDDGVLLLLSDSTNSERAGRSGSERDLLPAFERIFEEAPGRIVVASFASNIHRLQRVVELTATHHRKLAVVGRSLENSFRTARELGLLEVPEGLVVQIDKAGGDPRLVLLTAGSQGEPVSALARFAAQRHPLVNVREGDWVVISARPVPGNERLVLKTVDNLYRHGARVFHSELGNVHVSGHAYRDELREMLELVRPRYFIPVHGEYRQLLQHAEVAGQAGLAPERILIVEDGQTVELGPDSMTRGEKVPAGFVFVDGLGIGDVEQLVLRDRRHLAQDGIVVVTLAIERDSGRVRAGPELISRGFIEPELSDDLMQEARRLVLNAVTAVSGSHPDSSIIQDAARDAAARFFYKRTKRRPMVVPVVTEL